MSQGNIMEHKSNELASLARKIFRIGKLLKNKDLMRKSSYHRASASVALKYNTGTYSNFKRSFKTIDSDIDWAKKDYLSCFDDDVTAAIVMKNFDEQEMFDLGTLAVEKEFNTINY